MAKQPTNEKSRNTVKRVSVRSLEDLINLNLQTLEDVVSGEVDNKKAALIFTGSRTVTSSLKLGIEAMKLGHKTVAGMPVGADTSRMIK